jgi:glycosyltransferase involved in cell wall biosynthesis
VGIRTSWQADLSVIICTRNRATPLRRCLDVTRQQDYAARKWELVVVNNGSSDDTGEVARNFAAEAPFRVRVVDEPRSGLSIARNAGVGAATAPIIAFTDDDCYLARDYVTHMRAAFDNDSIGYVGGRILLHDPTDAEETIQTRDHHLRFEAGKVVLPGDMHGANLAFRREVWQTVGGFDPDLGPGTPFVCDDIDFITRASLAGFEGLYDPVPTVWHHHGRKPGRDLARLRLAYARGRGAYYMKGCLASPSKPTFARHWYWHLRTQLRSRRLGEAAREVAAALEYAVRCHSRGIFRKLSTKDASPVSPFS